MFKNSLFHDGEENKKVIRNPHADHHQKLITSRESSLARACQVWSTSVSAFVNLQNDRQNDHITYASLVEVASMVLRDRVTLIIDFLTSTFDE